MRAPVILLSLSLVLSLPARGQGLPSRGPVSSVAAPVELSALFGGGLWTRDAAALRGESRGLFRPDGEGLLRFASSPALPAATLFGIPVLEALVRFSPGGTPSGASFAFYTRGDAGRITPDGWKELCGNVLQTLSGRFAPAKGQPLSAHIGSARVRGMAWDTPAGRWTLRRGESDRPEYLTLSLAPPAGSGGGTGAPSSLKSTASTHTDRATQRSRVQDDGEGGKWLSVPMVDQGDKGYCAAASLERVLRFYGAEVDQHLLADLAGTDAEGGTSSLALKAAIDRTAHVFGVRRKDCASPDPLTDERARNNYDRAAKKLHLPTLPRPKQQSGGIRVLDVSGVDERVLQLARSKEKGFRQFQRDVKDAIDEGRPLMWGVTLFRDGVPAGGHMRLVIGYNEAKGVIYFSDSWGTGHEKEAMPYEEAWAITHLLFELVPKNAAMSAPSRPAFQR